jgi:hypothetical protein
MTKGDQLVERGAAFLEQLSRKAASEGGIAAKLAEPLGEDADFLRKMKPSLVMARIRGEAPTDGRADTTATVESSTPPPPAPPPTVESSMPPPAPRTVESATPPPSTVESSTLPPPPPLPPAPAANPKPKKAKKRGSGPNPIVVAAAAFVVGVFVAKLVDWRGHAHPRY